MKRLLEDVKACSHGKPGSRSLTDMVAAAILVGARGYMVVSQNKGTPI